MSHDNGKALDSNSIDVEPREPYIKGRVWIFAPEDKLKEWEKWLAGNPDFKFAVDKEITFIIRRDPLTDPREGPGLVKVFGRNPGEKDWLELDISGLKLPGAEGVSRRYRYNISQEVPPPEVVQALNRFFQKSKLRSQDVPDFSSLKAHADHIFTLTHVPGLSPVKIKGRKPAAGKDHAAEFSEQACWEAMGADKAYREMLQYKGEGVTVVIVDAAPELARISSELVDFVITLQEQGTPFEPEQGIEFLSIKELRALNKVQPPEDPAVFADPGSDAIEPQVLESYHGLLIASLIRELAPKARIVLVDAFNNDGETSGSLFKTAVNFVLALAENDLIVNNQPVRIISDPRKLVFNFSLGIPISSLREEVDAMYMLEECDKVCKSGGLIVAAAGNGSYYQHPRNPEEPAAYGYFADAYFSSRPTTFDQVIAVSASPANPAIREYAFYSNQGNLAAPDYYLLMDTGDDNNPAFPRFVFWAGTSFATPLVSGCAAVLLSAGAAPSQVKDCLWQGAQKPQTWREVPVINLQASMNYFLVPSTNQSNRINQLTGILDRGRPMLHKLWKAVIKLLGRK